MNKEKLKYYYLETSEFKKFQCGLGDVRRKQSGFPSEVTGSDSDHQRAVSPYESNPPKADYLVRIENSCGMEIFLFNFTHRIFLPIYCHFLKIKYSSDN